MPADTASDNAKPAEANQPGNNSVAAAENKQQPAADQGGDGVSRLMTPEGLIMLSLAAALDGAGLALIVLDAAFGIGVAFSPILSFGGYAIIFIWQAARSIGNDKGGQFLSNNLKRFFKKQGWKMGVEAVPILGDLSPTFLSIVYSELNNPNS